MLESLWRYNSILIRLCRDKLEVSQSKENEDVCVLEILFGRRDGFQEAPLKEETAAAENVEATPTIIEIDGTYYEDLDGGYFDRFDRDEREAALEETSRTYGITASGDCLHQLTQEQLVFLAKKIFKNANIDFVVLKKTRNEMDGWDDWTHDCVRPRLYPLGCSLRMH